LPRIIVVYMAEDDPRKNTSLKMIRHGLAILVQPRRIKGRPLILDPYSDEYLGRWNRGVIEKYGLLVYDCSWKKLRSHRTIHVRGLHRKLPPLLPGNPINYAKPCMLSSIEAVAATLYITGYPDLYKRLLGLYKWMNTFHTLNEELLREYSRAENPEMLRRIIRDFWGDHVPC